MGKLGYSKEDLAGVPDGANMMLGCGNPLALASVKPGETVVDLGCGGGFDCFLAAKEVGETGRVIGVDMTSDMITKARRNVEKIQTKNVEFRLGEIEHLPIADNTADIIMSNCVINLSPDKMSVYRDAYRVLKPGGRLAISDVVATAPLPDDIKNNLALLSACIGGAATIKDTEEMLKAGRVQGNQGHTQRQEQGDHSGMGPGKNQKSGGLYRFGLYRGQKTFLKDRVPCVHSLRESKLIKRSIIDCFHRRGPEVAEKNIFCFPLRGRKAKRPFFICLLLAGK